MRVAWNPGGVALEEPGAPRKQVGSLLSLVGAPTWNVQAEGYGRSARGPCDISHGPRAGGGMPRHSLGPSGRPPAASARGPAGPGPPAGAGAGGAAAGARGARIWRRAIITSENAGRSAGSRAQQRAARSAYAGGVPGGNVGRALRAATRATIASRARPGVDARAGRPRERACVACVKGVRGAVGQLAPGALRGAGHCAARTGCLIWSERMHLAPAPLAPRPARTLERSLSGEQLPHEHPKRVRVHRGGDLGPRHKQLGGQVRDGACTERRQAGVRAWAAVGARRTPAGASAGRANLAPRFRSRPCLDGSPRRSCAHSPAPARLTRYPPSAASTLVSPKSDSLHTKPRGWEGSDFSSTLSTWGAAGRQDGPCRQRSPTAPRRPLTRSGRRLVQAGVS